MYCAYERFQRSVRTDTHKLILYPEVRQIQLFDIVNDPWETKNLAPDPAHAKLISELYGRLTKLQHMVSDKLVLHPATFGIS
jgi:arylsulfatase A-like enzyme